MGLLDSIIGSLGSGGQGQNPLLQLITGFIMQHGGIEGVVQKFTAQGMGDQAQQWVGNGPNPPITGAHVQQAFGDDAVQEMADRLGVHPTQAAGGLAALLPAVIDKLTPHGHSVSGSDLEANIGTLLKGDAGGLGLGDLARLFGK
jgi:uncharacterized protein YidB (DUF937 family)